jgi:hypothetical protein
MRLYAEFNDSNNRIIPQIFLGSDIVGAPVKALKVAISLAANCFGVLEIKNLR